MNRQQERAILIAPWLGVILAGVSALLAQASEYLDDAAIGWGIHIGVAGVILIGLVTMALFNVDVLTHMADEGDRYEALRRRGHLRTGAILVHSIGILGTLILVISILIRADVLDWTPPIEPVRRGILLLSVAALAASVYSQNQALHVEMGRDRSDLRRAATALLGLASAIAAGLASYVTATGQALGAGVLRPVDAPGLLLAATILLSMNVALTRHLPSLTGAILDPGRQTAGGYTPEHRQGMAPIVVAFTVLGGFLLILVLLSAGVLQVLQQAGENGLVLIALLLMLGAVLAGIVLSMRTGKQADRSALYKQATASESRDRALILGISVPFGTVLLLSGIVLATGRPVGPLPESAWIHLVAFGILAALGPYGYHAGRQHHRVRLMEERFPDFLRDLSSSHRGGLTLPAAVQVAARGEYGPLSPEVVKMADQLTWHVSFEEALQRMADRVRTPLVRRTISLILEASRSGGNTADVLAAAARDARELKTLERQRRINMSVYTIVIYVVFFVFLFVIGVLYAQFVPAILEADAATTGSQFEGVGGLNFGGVTHGDYLRFYLTAGMVQAIGNGILAGVMGNGSAALGLRHASWMALVTYVTFAFIL